MRCSPSTGIATVLLVLVAACSTGRDGAADQKSPPTPTPVGTVVSTPPPTTVAASAPEPDVGVPDVVVAEEVEVGADLGFASTVRVTTAGTFVTPDFGQVDSVAGSGSGFIIDPSGLAVTNNHVVAGAAIVEVFFDGSDTPVPATVVAATECADLAVIDLAGDGYTALRWASDDVERGRLVRALGFPDGVRNISVSEGIVARVEQDAATPWAAIPELVQHDADIRPGSSGGPLLDADGNVVGVNVAASDTARYAIPSSVAQAVVADLLGGTPVDTLGINAVAVLDDVTAESGVWVVSIEPGSPADAAGLLPGDVITRMKGIRVGTDATLADYCGVVRSAGVSGIIPFEAIRGDGFIAGAFRGAVAEPAYTVLDDSTAVVAEPAAGEYSPPPAGVPYEAFDTITDDTGTVSLDVPTVWADRRTAPRVVGELTVPSIAAGFDLAAVDAAIMDGSYTEPGVALSVYRNDGVPLEETYDILTDATPWGAQCVALDKERIDDDVAVEGVFQAFVGCGGGSASVVSYVVRRIGEDRYLYVNIFAPTIADLEAAQQILPTFTLNEPADEEARSGGDVGAEGVDAEVDREAGTALDEMLSILNGITLPAGTDDRADHERRTASVTVRTYDTDASANEVEAWLDSTIAGLGCASESRSAPTGDDGSVSQRRTCELERGGFTFVVTLSSSIRAGCGEVTIEIVALA